MINNEWKVFWAGILLTWGFLWFKQGDNLIEPETPISMKIVTGMELKGKIVTDKRVIKKIIDHNQKVVIYLSSDGYMVACPLKEGEE